MATSGTNTFNLDVDEIIDQAADKVGGDLTSGAELKRAMTSLKLLLIDMQNQGHPLAELENLTFTTTASVASYTLASNVSDVLSVVVTRDGTDTPLKRIPLLQYHKLPTKTETTGLPSQFAIDRDRATTDMYIYPTSDNATDTIDYWALTYIEDVGSPSDNLDLNTRYLPSMVFGLAYFMSFGRTTIPADALVATRASLLSTYLGMLGNAQTEDRDRSSFKVTPYSYTRRKK